MSPNRNHGAQPTLTLIEGGASDRASLEGSQEHPREDDSELHGFYRKYAPSIMARCRALLRNEAAAEDAMQEVFARALCNLPSFRTEASPLTWLTHIATHYCLNQLRSQRNVSRRVVLQSASLDRRHDDGAGQMELRDQVQAHLAHFDLETQKAAVHYHVDGMTLEEVASLLGRSVPTIRKRLAHFSKGLSPRKES